MTSRTRGQNDAVNALRTIAAVVVVAGHLRILLLKDYDDVPHTAVNFAAYGLTSLGHQAVIVFFVLSGFWVGGSVLRGVGADRFSWTRYGIQRGTRLWIVLLPALALTVACDLVGRAAFSDHSAYNGADAYNGVVTDGPHLGVLDLLGNVFYLQAIYVPPAGTNTALWSLAYEFWFYVLFPLVVISVATRKVLPAIAAVAVAVLIGLEAISFFPIWCLGALVAYKQEQLLATLRRLGATWTTRARWVVGIGLVGLCVVARAAGTTLIGDYVVALGAAVFLTLLLTDIAPTSRVGRSITWGLSTYAHRSFSLYAIHLPIVVLLVAALGVNVDARWASDPAHWAGYFALLAVPIIVAVGFAAVTEQRTDTVRDWFVRRVSRRSSLT